jgi:hypothetical protein
MEMVQEDFKIVFTAPSPLITFLYPSTSLASASVRNCRSLEPLERSEKGRTPLLSGTVNREVDPIFRSGS